MRVEALVEKLKPRSLESIATISDGNHVSIAEYFCDDGVRYLKGAELSDVFIDDTEPTYIPEWLYNKIQRAQVAPGDVLLSVIGSVGPVALVTSKYKRLSCSCKLAVIRPREISAPVLVAYLLSDIGQSLIRRRNRGSVQQGVVLPDVRAFPVPKFDEALTRSIERIMNEASEAQRLSDELYPEAEAELLDRIGWEKLSESPLEISFVRESASLNASQRMDAEFFHPVHDRYRAALGEAGAPFGSLVNRFDKGTQPDDYMDGGPILVVKSKQVTGRDIALDNCERAGAKVWDDVPARLSGGDVVINSTGRGTLGRAGVVPSTDAKVVAAVDLIAPRLKKELIEPQYLVLFMNSPAGIAQSERFQTGSSGQLHLYPQHLAKFTIFVPRQKSGRVDLDWQKRLAAKAELSFANKRQSLAKLQEAKTIIQQALAPESVRSAPDQPDLSALADV